MDVRDQVEIFTNKAIKTSNHIRSAEESRVEPTVPIDAEFDQIYNKLVAKIKVRIDRSELPSITTKKEIKEEEATKSTNKMVKDGTMGDFMTTLRRTLKGTHE